MGLGNPGARFESTRHNVGFDVVATYSQTHNVPLRKKLFRPLRWSGCTSPVLAQPLTYMNRSGVVVPWLLEHCGLSFDKFLVVTDNLDLPAGKIRLKRGGKNRSHKGIASVIAFTGRTDFLRLYVGIGRPGPDNTVVEHVLERPAGEEAELIGDAIKRAVEAVDLLSISSVESVMNEVNR
ncbi:MAG: aminoacyl-tRNA hydrolase [Spirochaetota bacterium]